MLSCVTLCFALLSFPAVEASSSSWVEVPASLKIEVTSSDLQALKENLREYVPAAVTIGTNVYPRAGVRLKGMGAFLPLDQKPSFAVKFNEYERGKKFMGCSKILLNNSLQDPSFVSEVFANALFREAGLPAPCAGFAQVQFNGRDLGLYTLIEAVNEPFLEREFGHGKGNLYEGVAQDIDAGLDQDNGQPSDQSDVKALAAAARITNAVERFSQLEKRLDTKLFLRFVAMEMLLGHWDGYTMQRSNYRIYQHPGSRKFVFIPHGMDQTFRTPEGPIWPPTNSLLVRALLQTPQGRRLYTDELTSLATNLFQTNRISAHLNEFAAALRPELSARDPSALREWNHAFHAYRSRVLRRLSTIHSQLRTN